MRARPRAAGSLRRDGVRVHYCHPALRPLSARVLAEAVRSLRLQRLRLGFPAPLSDGGRDGLETDLYLLNLGRGGRAQANEEPAAPGDERAPGYVVIDYRTPEEGGYLASYVRHELHHLLQYALSRRAPGAFQEAVAAYVDDLLHPEARVLPVMAADFQRAPERPFYAHDKETTRDYGAAMFAQYLAWRFGPAVLREALSGPDLLTLLDAALRRRGSGLGAAVTGFAHLRVRTDR